MSILSILLSLESECHRCTIYFEKGLGPIYCAAGTPSRLLDNLGGWSNYRGDQGRGYDFH
jgi:hypothetical protein